MILILIMVVSLVAWALHLMQCAIEKHEFSLMLAGFLVSTAAAAMMGVYFLMGHYVGYMTEMSQRAQVHQGYSELAEWEMPVSVQPIDWSEVDAFSPTP
jgi:hypothetical protein